MGSGHHRDVPGPDPTAYKRGGILVGVSLSVVGQEQKGHFRGEERKTSLVQGLLVMAGDVCGLDSCHLLWETFKWPWREGAGVQARRF